jgi:peptide/nickel transport system substrate-binding protein
MRRRLFALLVTAAIAAGGCQASSASPAPSSAGSPAGSPAASPAASTPAASVPAASAPASAGPTAAATSAPSASATQAPASPSPSASAGADAPDLTTTSYAPEPPAKTGGTLILGQWQFVDAVNPYYFQAFADVQAFGALSFNGLVNTTHDLKYVPDLAAEVPLLSNGGVTVIGDGMDVNWKLKTGMKWSDGEPITCADLEATWKWNMDPTNTGLAAGVTGWEDIESVEARSDTDCVVHFSRVYEGYLVLFAPVLPKHYIESVPVVDAVTQLYPLGDVTKGVYSGPYIPVEVRTDAQITFSPNPNWETIGGHAPYLDSVIFKYYGDAAAMIAGYRAGEIDFAMELNNSDIPSLSDLPQEEVVVHDSLTYELFAFNIKRFTEKFGDDGPTIIRAIMAATDRQAIADGPVGGNVTLTENFISPLTWYYLDIGQPDAADPAGAEAALDAAGWAKGADGTRAKNGVVLDLDYCTTTRQYRSDTLALAASQMNEIGIRVNVLVKPSLPDVFGGWTQVPDDTVCNTIHGNYDVVMHGYTSPLDPLGGYNVYHSSGIPDEPPHNGQNETRVSIPALDEAYDTVRSSVDFAKVREAMHTIQEIYGSDENIFELPLFLRKDVWVVSPKIRNFTGNASTASGQWNIGDWWLAE